MPLLAAQAQPAPPGNTIHHGVKSATYEDVMREAVALHRARRYKDAMTLLSTYESEFAGDPYFDYQFGISAIEAGEPVVAQQALERAVLVKPDFAGAWVDLALAHARLGEVETALQIVSHVEESFNVPLALREQLLGLRADLLEVRRKSEVKTGALIGARTGYLQLSVGRDTNANLGLATSILSLTPIGGPPVQVEIAPSARATADAFMQLRGTLQQTLQFDELNKGRVYLSGQYKEFGTQTDYSLGDLAVSYGHEYTLPNANNWSLEGVVGVRGIAIGGSRLATLSSASLGLVYYRQGCRYGLRAGGEARSYGLSGYVNSSVPTASLSVTCQRGPSQYGFVASVSKDTPNAQRAGGETDRYELGAHYAFQYTPRLAMLITGLVGSYRDSSGYSPLLENGATRRISRASGRVEFLWQIMADHPEWALQAELEYLVDRSNLDVFNFKNTRAAVGLRYQF